MEDLIHSFVKCKISMPLTSSDSLIIKIIKQVYSLAIIPTVCIFDHLPLIAREDVYKCFDQYKQMIHFELINEDKINIENINIDDIKKDYIVSYDQYPILLIKIELLQKDDKTHNKDKSYIVTYSREDGVYLDRNTIHQQFKVQFVNEQCFIIPKSFLRMV